MPNQYQDNDDLLSIDTRRSNQHQRNNLMSKVPQVTLAFWIIKILATTVGETGGDALSMSLNLGYAVSSLIFLAFFYMERSKLLRFRLVLWLKP